MIRLGTAVSCLCANKDTDTAIVAGRNILKVFSVSDTGFEEVDSLRSRNHTSLNYSTNDIDWSVAFDTYFATAATNGAIVLWDIIKMSKIRSTQTVNCHTRTVNRVMFHPSDQLLLTGAQDGRIKFYDFRAQKVTAELPGNCSVRDMRFNPNPIYFSTASDNGLVMVWDSRNLHRAERTITCHNGAVLSIDWHTDPGDGRQWLVTCGLRDSLVKVWHTQGSQFTCTTQARVSVAVRKLRWRPERGSQQILTAHMMYPDLYVWDMARPFVPRLSFEGHTEPVTGLLWRDQRCFPRQFVSVGKDGMVFLRRIEESRQPGRETNPMGLSISCRGDVMVAYAESQLDPTRLDKADAEGMELCMTGTTNGQSGGTDSLVLPPAVTQMDSRSRPYIQSDPVDVGTKMKSSNSISCSGSLKRAHRDNRLPFSATSSLMMEFPSVDRNPQALTPERFVTLACSYRLTGAPAGVLCAHNARMAGQLGLAYVQALWMMLKSMCFNPVSDTKSAASAAPAAANPVSSVAAAGPAPSSGAVGISQANTPSMEVPTTPGDAPGTGLPGDGSTTVGGAPGTIVSDGGEQEEKEAMGERDDRGGYSRSGQETTTANSEDDTDMMNDGHLDKFVATFANVEPIDFLFSDGREEVDLLDVFTAAQNDQWAEDMGHLPREAIQQYHEIEHLPVTEMGEALEQHDLVFSHEVEQERDGFPDDGYVRPFASGTNNSHSGSQRRLRGSGGLKHASGREHGRRVIGETSATEHDERPAWAAAALVDYSSRAQASQSAAAAVPGMDYGPLISEMLVDMVERLGDVQSACCALIVIGEPLRCSVDFERYGVWLLDYLDLLARFQLWCESTMVIKLCGHPQVSLKNQEGTVINTKCSRCGKAVPPGGVCPKHVEKPPIACVVCHQAVRGLYMWCQGCGHGGHLQHMQEWLSNNVNCPAGCGHMCEYC